MPYFDIVTKKENFSGDLFIYDKYIFKKSVGHSRFYKIIPKYLESNNR